MSALFESVHVNIKGRDGNAFVIMAIVADCLRQAKFSKDEIEIVKKDMMSGDYEHLCKVASRYVVLDDF